MAKHFSQLTKEEQAEKFSRLPSWAQEKMTRLTRDLSIAEREVLLHRAGQYGPRDSNTVAEPYADQPINLPNDTSVEFNLDDSRQDSRKIIRVRITKDGKLDVNANATLWVNPRASNSIELTVGAH